MDGEAWNPANSQLIDFSANIGYQGNGASLPNWPVWTNLTDYGAVVNDKLSDVDALRDAISNCPPSHAIFLPDGRYIIDDFIVVNQNNIVIRGESRDGTIIFFPKHSNEILNVRESTNPMFLFSGGSNRGLENLTLAFRDEQKSVGYYRVPEKTKQYEPHWWYNGECPIKFNDGEKNSWLRNLYIKNGNHVITVDGNQTRNNTFIDIVLDNFVGRKHPVDGNEGHMGIKIGDGTQYNLFHNILMTGDYTHDTCQMGSSYNVFSRFKGYNVNIDAHAMGNHHNLYTEYDCGIKCTYGTASSHNYETYWGIKKRRKLLLPVYRL